MRLIRDYLPIAERLTDHLDEHQKEIEAFLGVAAMDQTNEASRRSLAAVLSVAPAIGMHEGRIGREPTPARLAVFLAALASELQRRRWACSHWPLSMARFGDGHRYTVLLSAGAATCDREPCVRELERKYRDGVVIDGDDGHCDICDASVELFTPFLFTMSTVAVHGSACDDCMAFIKKETMA